MQRITHKGDTVLFIECPVCKNRVSIVEGYPISGQEAEQELRTGFQVHVKDHEAAGETPMRNAKGRHR